MLPLTWKCAVRMDPMKESVKIKNYGAAWANSFGIAVVAMLTHATYFLVWGTLGKAFCNLPLAQWDWHPPPLPPPPTLYPSAGPSQNHHGFSHPILNFLLHPKGHHPQSDECLRYQSPKVFLTDFRLSVCNQGIYEKDINITIFYCHRKHHSDCRTMGHRLSTGWDGLEETVIPWQPVLPLKHNLQASRPSTINNSALAN